MNTTQDHEVFRDLIPAYAIGATDAEETAAVEEHLRHCATCRALLADYRALADDLLYAIPPAEAPDHLAERLRREIGDLPPRDEEHPQRRAAFLFPRLMRYAAVAVIFVLLLGNAVLLYRTQRLEEQVRVQATALAVLAEAPAVALHGDAPAPQSEGVLYLQPEAQVALLHVYNLPPVPEDKAYQIWLIHNGKRDSGGLFRVDERGEAVVLIRAPRPLAEYEAIGITVEPATGSPGPTGPRVIGGKF